MAGKQPSTPSKAKRKKQSPKIAIVWDFDGTLTPVDSTTIVVESLQGPGRGKKFWGMIKRIGRYQRKELPSWQHILASDAPTWMYALSWTTSSMGVPLNKEFFKEFILPYISPYPNAEKLLRHIKSLQASSSFLKLGIEVHHFIITAGLKDLVEEVFPTDLITYTFGCKYQVLDDGEGGPVNIPVFCMDETMKTRSLFEISKGSFQNPRREVNARVEKRNLWVPFENVIYIGDGDTDVPAMSLVRDRGGLGIAVFNPEMPKPKIDKRLRKMRLNKRADLITAADFSEGSELEQYLIARCHQIRQRYEAETAV